MLRGMRSGRVRTLREVYFSVRLTQALRAAIDGTNARSATIEFSRHGLIQHVYPVDAARGVRARGSGARVPLVAGQVQLRGQAVDGLDKQTWARPSRGSRSG